MDYTSQVLFPQSCVSAQRLAACRCATPEKEVTETEVLKKPLDNIQAQLAVMQSATARKAQVDSPDRVEGQIADIQAQVADKRKNSPSDHLEARDIKALIRKFSDFQD